MPKRVLLVFGTRPEAIKMAPIVNALKKEEGIETSVVVTAQHREMLDQVLDLFGIVPDLDLDLMRPSQGLAPLFSGILNNVTLALQSQRPDLVLVHGDTTTTLAASLAAFYSRIPLGHVEAGLRTGNIRSPWPEEANRRLVTPLADLHFAPTNLARKNLIAEGIKEDSVYVTGNTVIDALLSVAGRIQNDPNVRDQLNTEFHYLDCKKRVILVTGHRRESFGDSFNQVCLALHKISQRDDVQVLYTLHPNPKAQESAKRLLTGLPNVLLIPPQEYVRFVYLMMKAHLVVTDSGGIQEEAPSLGKPVLVTRNVTERAEAIEAGTVRLVGANPEHIISTIETLLDNERRYSAMASAANPYGDGSAALRIVNHIRHWLS